MDLYKLLNTLPAETLSSNSNTIIWVICTSWEFWQLNFSPLWESILDNPHTKENFKYHCVHSPCCCFFFRFINWKFEFLDYECNSHGTSLLATNFLWACSNWNKLSFGGLHFNKRNRKFLVVLCLVFFSPTIERTNLSSLFYMKQSLMVCWYKYRTDRDSVFRSSGPHWKFNHCLCNTEALYFLNPREFISYYAFLCVSPHIHSPLCRGCE